MTDTGQDIELEDEMTIAELEAIAKDTQDRLTFTFTQNNQYVECYWVNYYKTAGGSRTKVYLNPEKTLWEWKLLEPQKKVVRISI